MAYRSSQVRTPTLALFTEHTDYKAVPPVTALEADFPSVVFSHLAEHESWRKEVHRPATHTHKWWAQRLGSVFRAILASAITTSGDEAEAAYASALRLGGLTVFDPFAGSGTTLIEAAKVGATPIGWDINPVASLVQRQALQKWDIEELRRGYKLVEERCREEIDRLHRTESGETVLYYFWVALATCPQCSVSVRLFSNPIYAQHAYPKKYPRAQAVCPSCLAVQETRSDATVLRCENGHAFTRHGAVAGANMTCPNGHVSKILDALGGHPPEQELYAKLVWKLSGDKCYEAITDFDRELYLESVGLLEREADRLVLPEGDLEEGYNTRQAMRWGYHTWRDFFNARQLYSLGLIAAAIRDLDVGAAEREALATLFSGVLEFNNVFCSFKGEGTGAVRHMFSNHVLKPERTPLEAHPWGTPASSGSFSTLYRSRLLRAHEYKTAPFDQVSVHGKVQRVEHLSRSVDLTILDRWPPSDLGADAAYVSSGDAAKTDIPSATIDLVVTDPPYMDNVHYSELADFFHAWLRSVHPYNDYPRDVATTRSPSEVQSTSPESFGQAIQNVWAECERVMKREGLLAFTFHQARLSGWVALIKALAHAKLCITAIQPIKAEMSTSVIKSAAGEPSNLDSIIVCRKEGVGSPFADTIEKAESKATDTLRRLQVGGVSVGVGDARSVARGSVLSLYTQASNDLGLDFLEVEADRVADSVISSLRLA